MEIQGLLACANVMQSLIIFITLTANVPQWLAIHKCKNSDNLSISSWVMWLTGSFFALFYAAVNQCAYQNCLSLLITSAVSFFCNFYTIYLIQKYRAYESQSVKGYTSKAYEVIDYALQA